VARILVVEDMDDLREALCDVLWASGHTVHGATDGRDALDQLLELEVDVVLLDLHMPVMDGLRFLEERARTPKIAGVPVIVLSAWADRRELVNVAAKLTKPVQISELLAAMATVVHSIAATPGVDVRVAGARSPAGVV
jgi:CheY-like chemotaxis protein